MNATRTVLFGLLMTVMLVGCMVGPRHRGRGMVEVAPLPAVVELDVDSRYVHAGYHYHYRDNGWYYASSRRGPWAPLPKNYYPREVKSKHGDRSRHGGQNPGHKGR